jgi:hypothetical protein
MISDFGFRISDFGLRISDFGFRIADCGFTFGGLSFAPVQITFGEPVCQKHSGRLTPFGC